MHLWQTEKAAKRTESSNGGEVSAAYPRTRNWMTKRTEIRKKKVRKRNDGDAEGGADDDAAKGPNRHQTQRVREPVRRTNSRVV